MPDLYVAQTGSDVTGDGSVGNPYATPGKAADAMAAGTGTIYLKYAVTPYTMTTATPGAGGPVVLAGGTDALPQRLVGYDTNPSVDNTDANRPTVKAPVAALTGPLVTASGIGEVWNTIVDGDSAAGVDGIALTSGYAGRAVGCKVANCVNGIKSTVGTGAGAAHSCEVTGCSTNAFVNLNHHHACEAHHNTCTGFAWLASTSSTLYRCIAHHNTGATSDGIDTTGANAAILDCVTYANGRYGLLLAAYNRTTTVLNHASWGNTGDDIHTLNASSAGPLLRNCAATTVSLQPGQQSLSPIVLTADPFTNGPAGDLSLNTAAGGGALCRNAGYPRLFPGGTTSSWGDVGAARHQDAGGGGTYTAAANVRSGTDRGDGVTGTLAVPVAAQVLLAVPVDATIGTVVLPAAGDVEAGVTFGAALTLTGAFAVPAAANVLSPTGYGAGGTEFTGTLAAGGGGATLAQIQAELTTRGLTAAFTTGPIPANVTQLNGVAATVSGAIDSNLVSVNGSVFAGPNVPTTGGGGGASLAVIQGDLDTRGLTAATTGLIPAIKAKTDAFPAHLTNATFSADGVFSAAALAAAPAGGGGAGGASLPAIQGELDTRGLTAATTSLITTNLNATVGSRSIYAGGPVASVTAAVAVSDKTGFRLDLTQPLADDRSATVGGALAGAWATGWGKVAKDLINKLLHVWGPGNATNTASVTFGLDDGANPTTRTPQ